MRSSLNRILSKRKWIITSVLAVIGVMILIRLGFWQLDRLEWRRAFNNHYLSQINQPDVNLNDVTNLDEYTGMEYRGIYASGTFDFSNEVFLQNQANDNLPGYRVVTPLMVEGKNFAIMVDRGWIPLDDVNKIDEIDQNDFGDMTISGVIRASQEKSDFGIDPDKQKNSDSKFWLIVNLKRIQNQISYPIAPFYIQLESDLADELPIASLPEIEITEGPHLGYAIQWFFFASLLGFGYPFYVLKILRTESESQEVGKDD